MSETGKTPPTGRAPTDSRRREARRRFLRSLALGGVVLGAGLAGLAPVKLRAQPRLRPPGALDEHDFLASCIKCGQCVQVCPVEAIRLGELADGFGVGVPYIEPRAQACDFSCDAVQCVLACPTGALTYHKPEFLAVREGARLAAPPVLLAKAKDPEPTINIRERLGVARLVRPEACLAVRGWGFQGQARGPDFKGLLRYITVDRWRPILVRDHPYYLSLCDLCVRECPIQGAIALKPVTGPDGVTRMTPTVAEPCVGCGVCEMMCPVEPSAITVAPRAPWEAA